MAEIIHLLDLDQDDDIIILPFLDIHQDTSSDLDSGLDHHQNNMTHQSDGIEKLPDLVEEEEEEDADDFLESDHPLDILAALHNDHPFGTNDDAADHNIPRPPPVWRPTASVRPKRPQPSSGASSPHKKPRTEATPMTTVTA
jgi:hypothetical protein